MLDSIRQYYEDKLSRHGATARGVDWNSNASQETRFERLMTAVDGRRPFSINDYGCGYGALAQYLIERDLDCSYNGYDISSQMIAQARELTQDRPAFSFAVEPQELSRADYTVASGLFNVKLSAEDSEWKAYVLDTIADMAAVSRLGFAFNMLTADADADRKRPDLYYADSLFFFRHCKEHYSRWVALLHDYGLYEFTLVVRRDERRAWEAGDPSTLSTTTGS